MAEVDLNDIIKIKWKCKSSQSVYYVQQINKNVTSYSCKLLILLYGINSWNFLTVKKNILYLVYHSFFFTYLKFVWDTLKSEIQIIATQNRKYRKIVKDSPMNHSSSYQTVHLLLAR